MALNLKCWRRNLKKERYEKNGEKVQVAKTTTGKGTKLEKVEYWVVYGKPMKIKRGFSNESQAVKFTRSYLKRHDKC